MRKRYYKGRRRKRRQRQPEPEGLSPLEQFLDLMIDLIVGFFRLAFRAIAGLVRPKSTPVANVPQSSEPKPPRDTPPSQPYYRSRHDRNRANREPSAVADRPLPYRRKPHVMSKGERALWYPLYKAVQGKYRLFCKVRLADLVGAPTGRDERYWFKKIRGYHVDFVLCHPDTTAPLLVIELDDRTHRSPKAKDRDAFKDAVCQAAGLPIYRIPARQAYDPIELGERIEQLVGTKPA